MSIFNMMIAGGGGSIQKATSTSANATRVAFPITQIPKEWVLVRVATNTNVQSFAGIYKTGETYYRITGRDTSAAYTSQISRTVITTLSETLTSSSFRIDDSKGSFVSGASYILYYI